MSATAKGKVLDVSPANVNALGVRETPRVVVGCSEQQPDGVAGGQGFALYRDGFTEITHDHLHRALPAQQLLDRTRDELRLLAKELELLWLSRETQHRSGNRCRGGLESRREQATQGADQLCPGQAVAAIHHCDETGNQIILRLRLPVID